MKIFSLNVNGIRSTFNKNFNHWFPTTDADIFCFQEIKATQEHFPLDFFTAQNYNTYLFPSIRKGYSGVAIVSRKLPQNVVNGIDNPFFDAEGRSITLFYHDFVLINAYFPSGSNEQRQAAKFQWLDIFYNYIAQLLQQYHNVIICGDFNICRLWIDIHNPQGHIHDSGFLPEERQWFAKFMDLGFVDTFRIFNNEENQYTWWSYRAASRQRNKGWRIDYILVSHSLKDKVKMASIHNQQFFSDHCPVSIDIEL